MMKHAALLVVLAASPAAAVLHVKTVQGSQACATEDLQHRAQLQNKLAGVCEDMCKEVGAYPKCSGCPDFVPPDATPGVMTWDELLEHMDNLVDWGRDQLKGWRKQASTLQKAVAFHAQDSKACAAEELRHRAQLQNKLAGVCEDMCKEVGAYPKCSGCPDFVPPDSTPGVMTWDELLEHMDNLSYWGHDMIKGWKKQASALQKAVAFDANLKIVQNSRACTAQDLQHRSQVQNKLAGVCEDMCKEVGAYPKCSGCPDFVPPDSTPGVMTWDELLEHMDNLSYWGHDMIKGWKKQASALQKAVVAHVQHLNIAQGSKACAAEDLQHRSKVQNKLAGVCEDMCKEVGAYPKCSGCPDFVPPDATPGVMTWDELLEHMDNLSYWGHDMIKGWKATAAR